MLIEVTVTLSEVGKVCGDKIKELRKRRRITQSDLAKIVNVTQDSISLWEMNKRVPDTQYVILLADYFNVSTDFLLGRSDDFGNGVISESNEITPEEKELLTLFRGLPNIRRKTVMDSIRFISESSEVSGKRTKDNFF